MTPNVTLMLLCYGLYSADTLYTYSSVIIVFLFVVEDANTIMMILLFFGLIVYDYIMCVDYSGEYVGSFLAAGVEIVAYSCNDGCCLNLSPLQYGLSVK